MYLSGAAWHLRTCRTEMCVLPCCAAIFRRMFAQLWHAPRQDLQKHYMLSARLLGCLALEAVHSNSTSKSPVSHSSKKHTAAYRLDVQRLRVRAYKHAPRQGAFYCDQLCWIYDPRNVVLVSRLCGCMNLLPL